VIRSIPDLFHPHDPALVEAAMLANTRLHLKDGNAAAFAKLLPWETLNTLPTAERLLDSELKIAQRGRDAWFDMAVPRAKHGEERPLRAEALHGLCDQGMSLVLNSVEKRVPAIAALNAMVERHFRARVATNAYVSFQAESAFPPHFDDHNVLVLQVHGSKRWFLHGQPYRYPLVNDRFPHPKDPGPVEAEILMEPGDLLFVPRGDVHWAEVAGPSSLHLTLTVQPTRGRDLLRWLGTVAEREEIGREDINPLEGPEAQAGRAERLRTMLRALADGLDLDAFQDEADQAREPVRPFNLGHLHELTPGTLVLPSLRRRIALPEDGKLGPAGGNASITAGEREVLKLLLARDGLTVGELATALTSADVTKAVNGLARKALVFLFPGE
jgi:hypothetical protein